MRHQLVYEKPVSIMSRRAFYFIRERSENLLDFLAGAAYFVSQFQRLFILEILIFANSSKEKTCSAQF